MRALARLSFAGVTLAVTSLLAACSQAPSGLHGSPYLSPSAAPGLQLQDTQGNPFDLSALEGHAVLVYFGYTQCPDECPLTLANARWAIEQLGERGEQVDFVLVTVDPVNDTPAVLRADLYRFDRGSSGLPDPTSISHLRGGVWGAGRHT